MGRQTALLRRLGRRVLTALPEGRAIAEDVWERRHRGMMILLWLHVPVVGAYSLMTNQGLRHSLIEAAIVAAPGVAAARGPRNRRFRSVCATLGLVSSSAILVHLSGGLIEMHFHYFVSLAVVSLYHDWAPFLTAVVFVALQHGVMGVVDPHSVYNHAGGVAGPWKWAGIHAFFVLAASAVSLVRWKSSEVEALKDPLTGLPNRALFGDRLRQALTRGVETGRPVSVLFLDVDDFKSINDTAGHAAGDGLLVALADRLREVVRPGDTVARLGGDEFAIVLEDIDDAQAAELAHRIQQTVRSPLTLDGRVFAVSTSIGVAVAVGGAFEQSDVIRNADIAMYAAKKGGKGRHALFEPGMHRRVLERNQLAKDLRGAIDREELQLHYQPVNRIANRGIAGFEALLRWHHPFLGTVPPAKFIPLAEETGDIVPIGAWVLEEACRQMQAWRDDFDLSQQWMSVNVSVRQLVDDAFVGHVERALESSGLPPSCLVLEITESAMVGDEVEVIGQLHRLKAVGVRLALDDFGTGYSSLGYLRRLPIDIVKIDKTFIDGTDRGAEDAALARAILKISESMGLECIAEGVEREGQSRALLAAGCVLAQGFLYAKPMEASHVAALLRLEPARSQARGVVVVADTDAAERRLVGNLLDEAGFVVFEAATIDETIATLAAGPNDLLVLDARLSDAESLVEHAYRAWPELPVLLLSDARPGDRPAAIPRGASVLYKPFQAEELVSSARRLMGSEAAVRTA